jgi:hypothetical protein
MYTRRRKRGEYTQEWMDKTTDFVIWAFARNTGSTGVLCPCGCCSNKRPQIRGTMIGHKLPKNLYEAKKLLGALNMPYEKIDACPNHCMLFRKENADKTQL